MLQNINMDASMFLVVDNYEWVVRLTKWRLQRLLGNNIKVVTGCNGEDAIQIFEKIVSGGNHSRVQAVLVGCHMPVYTGMQAVEEIRNIERAHNVSRSVNIIGTSTDLNSDVYEEFMRSGADVVLEKPVPDGELEHVVTELITGNH